jgi:chromosome segregation ATPase
VEKKDELEIYTKKDQELVQSIEDKEARFAKLEAQIKEQKKRNECLRKELKLAKKEREQTDKELAAKEALYDQQLMAEGGVQAESLQARHAQILKELDTLQNAVYELEEKKESYEIKLNQKNTEVGFDEWCEEDVYI